MCGVMTRLPAWCLIRRTLWVLQRVGSAPGRKDCGAQEWQQLTLLLAVSRDTPSPSGIAFQCGADFSFVGAFTECVCAHTRTAAGTGTGRPV